MAAVQEQHIEGEGKPKVALIWGANGISGNALLRELLERPSSEWSRVIAVSRHPLRIVNENQDQRLKFVQLDVISSSVDEISKKLREVEGADSITNVFHYCYIEKEDENEAVKVNEELLDKALRASAQVSSCLRLLVLQTGYKYYGIGHKEPERWAPTPFREDTPRTSFPNFYYNQEDLLRKFAKNHGLNFLVTRPNFVIGVAKGNYMNLAGSIALYALIQKQLGNPLVFPGNQSTWNGIRDHSDARNNARFVLWACCNRNSWDDAYNIHNGDMARMRDNWPKIAEYFGMKLPSENFKGKCAECQETPQLCVADFMKDKDEVWKLISKQHGLPSDSIDAATWKFMDFAFGRTSEDVGSMEKARKLGWETKISTPSSYVDTFNEMKKYKMLPQSI